MVPLGFPLASHGLAPPETPASRPAEPHFCRARPKYTLSPIWTFTNIGWPEPEWLGAIYATIRIHYNSSVCLVSSAALRTGRFCSLAREESSGARFVRKEIVLGKKLHVGNLGFNVGSSDLEKLFGKFGTVTSAQVIEDRETGRSKGFAFVEMSSDQEAQAAIQGLNEQEHDGRPLKVNEARPKEDRGGRQGGGYGGGGRGGRY